MQIDAGAVGSALADVWERLLAAVPGAWTERAPGLMGGVTLIEVPTMNGVWAYGRRAQDEPAAELLERVAAAGLPHCFQVCPGCRGVLRDLACSRGMVRDADIPLMVLEGEAALNDVKADGLVINVLPPEQAIVHADLAAAGFEAPVEAFRKLMSPAVMRSSGLCCYVGDVGGTAVATAFSVRINSHVGIFNVATLPTHRRRRYGAAITARAVQDALRDGADWAWLQSTEAGYRVYERLGFRTLETWECWIADANDEAGGTAPIS